MRFEAHHLGEPSRSGAAGLLPNPNFFANEPSRSGGARLLPSLNLFANFALAMIIFNLGLVRCYTQPVQSPALKIGVLLPPDEAQGASIREGILLAKEEAPKTCKTNIEVIIRGRVGQWGADADEAARMVIDDGASGLIAPPDGAASHLALQVSGRTATPVVSLCADSLVSRTGVPWMVRVVPRTIDEAQALFQGASGRGSGQPRRWAAVVPQGRTGREVSHDIKEAASLCGCEMAALIEASNTATNYDRIRTEALESRPEGILIWLAPIPAGRFARELRKGGYNGVLAGPGWLNCADFFAAAQNVLEGFYIPAVSRNAANAGLFRVFQTAYRNRWGHDPDAMAGMSYDAVIVLIHLIQSTSQTESHRLSPGFSQPGVTGDLRFDLEGNRKMKLDLLKGHAGSFARSDPQ